jgi:hypothetical protein
VGMLGGRLLGNMGRGMAASRAYGVSRKTGIIGRSAGGAAGLISSGVRKGWPYIGAFAAGGIASSQIHPTPIAEGTIDNIYRSPAYEKMNFNTAGLPLRMRR